MKRSVSAADCRMARDSERLASAAGEIPASEARPPNCDTSEDRPPRWLSCSLVTGEISTDASYSLGRISAKAQAITAQARVVRAMSHRRDQAIHTRSLTVTCSSGLRVWEPISIGSALWEIAAV